jgi:hypothetical protein
VSRLTIRAATLAVDPRDGLVELDLGFGPNGFGAAEAARLVYGGPERRTEIHGYGTRLSGALIDLLRAQIGDRLAGVIGPVRHLERELSLATAEGLRERARIESFRVNLIDGRVRVELLLERGARLSVGRLGNELRVDSLSTDTELVARAGTLLRREIPAISNAMSQVRLFVPRHLAAA